MLHVSAQLVMAHVAGFSPRSTSDSTTSPFSFQGLRSDDLPLGHGGSRVGWRSLVLGCGSQFLTGISLVGLPLRDTLVQF
jgi:hypothetical protein